MDYFKRNWHNRLIKYLKLRANKLRIIGTDLVEKTKKEVARTKTDVSNLKKLDDLSAVTDDLKKIVFDDLANAYINGLEQEEISHFERKLISQNVLNSMNAAKTFGEILHFLHELAVEKEVFNEVYEKFVNLRQAENGGFPGLAQALTEEIEKAKVASGIEDLNQIIVKLVTAAKGQNRDVVTLQKAVQAIEIIKVLESLSPDNWYAKSFREMLNGYVVTDNALRYFKDRWKVIGIKKLNKTAFLETGINLFIHQS